MQANELREFADQLDLAAFKALSTGIGIGAVKTIQPAPQTMPRQGARAGPTAPPHGWMPQVEVPPPDPRRGAHPGQANSPVKKAKKRKTPKAATPGAARAAPLPKAAAPRAGRSPRPRLGLERKLVAWGLDFFFVGFSLFVLLALVTLLTAVRTGETEDVFALAPVQWLMGINPLQLVAGVYALFFAYVILFKLVAGVTLGETLLRARLARGP